MIKAIVFDFDDTLEKYKVAKHYAEKEVAKYIYENYGIKNTAKILSDIDLYYMIKGRTKKDIRLYHRELWFHDFFYRIGIKPKKAEIKKLVNFYWKSIQEKAKLMPHTKKVLVRLKKELKLIVISDSDGNKAIKLKRLRKLGVFGLFDLVITGDDVNTTKPDERFYTAAFKKLKVRPSECVMVGDKPEYDLKLAKKLGMKTVWFVYGDWAEHEKNKKFNYVDYKIKRLDELISIVTKQ